MLELFKLLNEALERRAENSKENYRLYVEYRDENIKLRAENKALRKDLEELSKEYFKKEKDGKKKTN
jgi:regulator of replication initiation timing